MKALEWKNVFTLFQTRNFYVFLVFQLNGET